MAAEFFFTRTFDEVAENSRVRRNHLATWPVAFVIRVGIAARAQHADAARSRDVSCD